MSKFFSVLTREHLLIWRRVKTNDAAKLQDEYARLVEGLQESMSDNDNDTDGFMGNPCTSNVTYVSPYLMVSVLPDDLLNEAIPGNIRKAEHFVAFLKRFVEYLKVPFTLWMVIWLLTVIQTRMRVLHVVAETPLSFLQHLKDITYIERRPLRYVFDVFHCTSWY